MNGQTIVISGFPGVGKTFFKKHVIDYTVLDSDSSTFDKKEFPQNYIKHIVSNIGKIDFILVNSHKEVREALVEYGIKFILVYPEMDQMESYIKMYKERNSPQKFIDLVENNWGSWITELDGQVGCKTLTLGKNEYLINYLNLFRGMCHFNTLENNYGGIIDELYPTKLPSNLQVDEPQRPPLGLTPKFIHDERRLDEVKGAIQRYINSNIKVPIEWIDEYETLIKK